MSGENTLAYKFYMLEKAWLKEVESLLTKQIPFIKDVLKRTEKQGIQEYCDCKAEVYDCSLVIVTQNFRFVVTDIDYEFNIKYRILDEYTRENAGGMWGIETKGELYYISKKIESEPLCYINLKNYPIFTQFIMEIESLDVVLKENQGE